MIQGEKEIVSIHLTNSYWPPTLRQWGYNGEQEEVKVLSSRGLGFAGETLKY